MVNLEIQELLQKEDFNKEELVRLLKADLNERNLIYKKAAEIKTKYIGNITYFRGLIEMSNRCEKDCYYCGIRASNKNVQRYELDDESILYAAKYAYEKDYASIVLQAGERSGKEFTLRIENLLRKIKELSNGELGITISLGEQTEEVYKRWFEAGASRFLLRIETSNEEIYKKIHPENKKHEFRKRLESLENLRKIGYQTGTGVMIGLPFQTYEDLADDLLFFKKFDIDMVGMGPFIEHSETPLYEFRNQLMSLEDRFNLTMKMTAILRIFMKDINIAAATAMQAIDPAGREKAIKVGANIIMPNITPTENRKNYQLYENKPCIDEAADDCKNCLEARISIAGDEIGYGKKGDSKHYFGRKDN